MLAVLGVSFIFIRKMFLSDMYSVCSLLYILFKGRLSKTLNDCKGPFVYNGNPYNLETFSYIRPECFITMTRK